jgi:hypothetical protein
MEVQAIQYDEILQARIAATSYVAGVLQYCRSLSFRLDHYVWLITYNSLGDLVATLQWKQ